MHIKYPLDPTKLAPGSNGKAAIFNYVRTRVLA